MRGVLLVACAPPMPAWSKQALRLLDGIKSTLRHARTPFALPHDEHSSEEMQRRTDAGKTEAGLEVELLTDTVASGLATMSISGRAGRDIVDGGGQLAGKGPRVHKMLTPADKMRKKQEAKERLLEAELARCTFNPSICSRSAEFSPA